MRGYAMRAEEDFSLGTVRVDALRHGHKRDAVTRAQNGSTATFS
jgi:hypothetical protein